MQNAVRIMNMYVEAWVNWLFPAKVSFSAIPKAFTDMTETEPTVEQIER